jgi:hypothetical protein
MAVIRRINQVPTPGFNDGDLGGWLALTSTTISAVSSGSSRRMRITFPSGAGAGTRGAVLIIPVTPGAPARVWASVPTNNSAGPVQIGFADGTTGASFTTNDPVTRAGAFNMVGHSTGSLQMRITNAATSIGGYIDVDYVLYDEGTTTDYPYFDGSIAGAEWTGKPNASPSLFPYYDTEVSARPIAVVEFDAHPVRPGEFVLDRDPLYDTVVPNTSQYLAPTPSWVAVPEAESVSINRGRDSDDQEIGPGTATIVIDDPESIYDPDNPGSPLQVALGHQAVHAGMGIRVTALAQNLGELVELPMFTGTLDDMSIDRGWEPTVTVTAIDDLTKLNNADIPPLDPPIGAADTTLARALWALGYAGAELWDDSNAVALTRLMLPTAGGGNVGSHIRDVAACEGGKVFVKADGRLHIGTHADDFAYVPAATFTDDQQADDEIEYDDIVTSTSINSLINRSIITRGDPETSEDGVSTGAPAVSAQDDDSIAFCGRVYSETVDIPLYSQADAEAMARWRATRRSRAATQVDSVKFAVHSQPLAWHVLGLDLTDVIGVRRQAWNRTLDGTYSIEGISWEITAAGPWVGTVSTSPLRISTLFADGLHPFFIGTSELDGPDIIAAY